MCELPLDWLRMWHFKHYIIIRIPPYHILTLIKTLFPYRRALIACPTDILWKFTRVSIHGTFRALRAINWLCPWTSRNVKSQGRTNYWQCKNIRHLLKVDWFELAISSLYFSLNVSRFFSFFFDIFWTCNLTRQEHSRPRWPCIVTVLLDSSISYSTSLTSFRPLLREYRLPRHKIEIH